MIYLETPVGVGFSYSENHSDYNTDDSITAQENLATMNAFFAAWPEWKSNDFFIVGFSYAGIYVPTLAESILWAERNGTWFGPELKGIAVGNGVIGTDYSNDRAQAEFFLRTAFVNATLRRAIHETCSWSKLGAPMGPFSSKCRHLLEVMRASVGPVNEYNVDRECIQDNDECPCFSVRNRRTRYPLRAHTCIGSDQGGTAYLNQPALISAAHLVKPAFKWSACSSPINYTRARRNLPRDTYPFLIANIKVTIYNGDRDASVPYTSDEAWTENMGFKVKTPWHPWTYGDNQVGGFATVYDQDLSFVTVKGAGHLVPADAPEQAFELIRRVVSFEGFGNTTTETPFTISV
jgi:carboxypeptidase C (cathepsin A)